MAFRKATKEKIKLRMALIGPTGSGKTYSALAIATALGKRVAVIDSEGRENTKDPKKEKSSVALYSRKFDFDFDLLKTYHPNNYIAKIHEAEEAGYDVIVIDSLTHAWNANEGALDLVAKEQIRNKSSNQFTAWRHVTPLVNALVETIIASTAHVIVTMRAKEKTVMEVNEKGRSEVRKLGMEAVMRDGMEYEFDIVLDLDKQHNAIVSKTRLDVIDGQVINKPGEDFAKTLLDWLNDGEDPGNVKQKNSAPTKKATTTPNVGPVVPASLAQTTEETVNPSPEVQQFVSTVYEYLTKKATDGNAEAAIDYAKEICAVQFQIQDILKLPVEQLPDLKTFMRGPLLESLRKDGLLKAGK
jgi:ABC-type dipeptide/oligopeptide/nickel transport system ATPase component